MASATRIDELLTSPWSLWVISVTVALLLWHYVMRPEDGVVVSRSFSCPLEYRNVDPQSSIRDKVTEVRLEVRGTEKAMAQLDYSAVACIIDLQHFMPGRKYAQNVKVELPAGIDLVSCSPSQVVVDLIRQITRLIPIEVLLPSDIPDGQYLEQVEVLPKEIAVRGSERDVARIGGLQVRPSLRELEEGKQLLLPVKILQSEPFEGDVVLEPNQVKVRAALVRGYPKKRVRVNVRLVGTPSGDYDIAAVVPEPAEVWVEGHSGHLNQIDTVDTEAVNISSISANQTIVVPLKPISIKDISLLGDKTVKVQVYVAPRLVRLQLPRLPVEIRGGKPTEWALSPSSVTATLEGAPSKIQEIRSSDVSFQPYVDVSGVLMDAVVLPVRVDFVASEDVRLVKLEPKTITINANKDAAGW